VVEIIRDGMESVFAGGTGPHWSNVSQCDRNVFNTTPGAALVCTLRLMIREPLWYVVHTSFLEFVHFVERSAADRVEVGHPPDEWNQTGACVDLCPPSGFETKIARLVAAKTALSKNGFGNHGVQLKH
jgi:hypothetical protein